MYDFLIVGAGLYGSVMARELTNAGKSVLVIEKRDHIGGNCYTENIEGINVHKYGAHIFHTNNEEVWTYINKFAKFNRYTNSPIAKYNNEIYSLPFNMYTFNKLWGVTSPQQAQEIIKAQVEFTGIIEPKNLEEQALSLVGKDIYETLIKGYTEKQWGRECKDLPAFIIKRLPLRFTYDNNYFNARFQGIPIGGYTKMIKNILSGIEVEVGVDYLKNKEKYNELCKKIIYTGPIDGYYNYSIGNLEYRSLRFNSMTINTPNYQGNAVVNYTNKNIPWTRIIEHKWFEIDECKSDKTIITEEYSCEWEPGSEPYYPINDEKNNKLYSMYKNIADKEKDVIFGGRLGEYKYYDMDQVIESVLNKVKEILK